MLLPTTAPLVGMLMLGNLFRECGVVRQLTETASNALMYIVVILLGTSVGASTSAEAFLNVDTLKIVVLGLVAFAFGTFGGVMLGQLMKVLTKGSIDAWKDQSSDRLGRRVRCSDGGARFAEGRCAGGSHELPADARDGPQCGRCYRYCRSGRNLHGNLWRRLN